MIIKNVELETVCGITSKLPDNQLPEVAFAGKSNVGKSSLINALVNRKALARTSGQPGKTQTINFYNVNKEMYIVDLPGYGYAKVSKSEKKRWQELIGGYFAAGRDIGLVFSLVDMRHPPTADDITMINFLIDSETPFCVVLTKADKLNKSERTARLEALKDELPMYDELTILTFSAVTGEGVDEIRQIIREVSSDEQ